jgi:hypothetical protein
VLCEVLSQLSELPNYLDFLKALLWWRRLNSYFYFLAPEGGALRLHKTVSWNNFKVVVFGQSFRVALSPLVFSDRLLTNMLATHADWLADRWLSFSTLSLPLSPVHLH